MNCDRCEHGYYVHTGENDACTLCECDRYYGVFIDFSAGVDASWESAYEFYAAYQRDKKKEAD